MADKSTKRSLILDAAVTVFADKGFHSARVSDIARVAGVADGTIYLYFKSKEDVLLQIFEVKMDELREGLLSALEGVDNPLERIRVFAHYHFGQVQKHSAVAEVLQVELRLSKKFIKDYKPRKLWAYLAIFNQIIRDGQQRGLVRPNVNPFTTMWAFFGALDEIGMQWVLARNKDKFNLDDAANEVAEVFIRGVAA